MHIRFNTTVFRGLALVALSLASQMQVLAQQKEGAAQASAITLNRVSPAGDNVPPPAQLVFEFSGPVVPLGRMERTSNEIAVKITPSLSCQWRWLNVSTLACNVNEGDRPVLATTYSISIPASIDTTSTATLAESAFHSFTTSRPEVVGARVAAWTGPGSPEIVLRTNQPTSFDSLVAHVTMQDTAGTAYPIAVAEATKGAGAEEDEEEEAVSTKSRNTVWSVVPKAELPLDTSYTLSVSPGLESLEGKERGIQDGEKLTFHTFPKAAFLGVSCFDLQGSEIWNDALTPRGGGDSAVPSRCDPLNSIQLVFNSPVLKEQLKEHVSSKPDIRAGQVDFDPWEEVFSYSRLSETHRKGQTYAINLPYGLKAFSSYTLSADGSAIHDEFGRALTNNIDITFLTDHRNPRYALDNSFSVLELESDSKLPVIVNNLEAINLSYQRVTTHSNESGLTKTLTPYKVQDIAYRYPIDIRGLLADKSGVIQGQLTTAPSTTDGSRWFFSQVTPFGVHLKLGHFNSLAWVTSLKTGEPIAGAKVSITPDTLTALRPQPKQLANAITDERGIATLPGSETLDPKHSLLNEWEPNKERLVARIEKDGQLAVVPLSWDLQVFSDGAYPNSQSLYGHIRAWGTTAQGLYKVGDTVQFSLWVRNQNVMTLTKPPREGYKLQVLDPTETVVFEVPAITLSDFGRYSGEFTTGPNAAVGWYRFLLSSNATNEKWSPLRVLISDFTPAPFKVTTELNSERFQPNDTLTVTTQARLHAGGPYSEAGMRVNARIEATALHAAEPKFETFSFESDTDKSSDLYEKEEKLDSKGDHTTTFTIQHDEIPFGDLVVESAVRDDRGKFVASVARKPFVGRDRYVGLAQSDWILSVGKEAIATTVAINERLSAVAGTPIHVEWFYEETKVARVKSAGNVYIPRYEQEFVLVGSCDVTSQLEAVACAHTPSHAGRYRITASVKDSKGRSHVSNIFRWATGSGEVVWQAPISDELPIVPEKKSYKVGETARFFIRNPFPGAKALLTIERYGIQRSWIETWGDSAKVIEIPITPEHIPGFYFSATVTSPRVDKPIENQVDLGKPSFKMGYAQVDVLDSAKELLVDVKPRGEVFKPGELVTVDLKASPRQGVANPIEYAVTVLDESVFALVSQGRSYFDPYKGFYELDSLDVANYNLIKMLIGRQNFEKKGASPGGDGGGKLDLRSIKKFVSYWNPAIKADAEGKATITFKTPDNLTGWRVFAIALTEGDRMGLGDASFKVNKEIETRSALPNLVRVGDSFNAVFTVMNRTEKTRSLTVEAKAEGDATASSQTVTIFAEPFKRYPVALAAKAMRSGSGSFSVRAYDQEVSDTLTASVPITERAPLTTASNFGSAEGEKVSQAVQIPSDIVPAQGSIGAVLAPSIIGGLTESFAYMRDYPYSCWEQKISKAVMAARYASLKRFVPKQFEWPDSAQIIKKTLDELPAFQAPNGGMSFYIPSDTYSNRYLSAFTALALTWLRQLGHVTSSVSAEEKLRSHLLGLLRNDDFPDYLPAGARSAIRSIIVAALAPTGLLRESDLLRLRPSLPTMPLFGKAHYLIAAIELKASSETQAEALHQIMSLGNESSATFSFTEPSTSYANWLLDSPTKAQCAALEALLQVEERGAQSLRTIPHTMIPKLVRTLTLDRKRKDRWENTQENLFCMTAIAHYSRLYEKSSSQQNLTVEVQSEKLATVAFSGPDSEALEVSRPLTANDSGKEETVTISPTGSGRFYYTTRLAYMSNKPTATAENAGIEVTREYSVKRAGSWSVLKNPIAIEQGELVRVDLFLKVPTSRYYVVVDDPVPGGLEALNRDLATTSSVDAQTASSQFAQGSKWWISSDWIDFGANFWSFYHRELRHAAARFYSEHLPASNYHLTYTAQAIAEGTFIVPPTHVEEMYDPDVFGRSAGDTLIVSARR